MLLFLLLRAEILGEMYQSGSRIREKLQAVTKMPQKFIIHQATIVLPNL
ncbi:hypothetical protein [Campylobacter concisus]|jgi:hypothetical protein